MKDLKGTCPLSNSQIDKLGDEIQIVKPNIDHLKQLNFFRQSFADPYQFVIHRLTSILKVSVTGRPSKSTSSIVEKLRRETIRLSQMQDISGCRILVRTADEQERLVEQIRLIIGSVAIDDRRHESSHGYRAMHVIARMDGRPIEIQVRTELQHLWAEISEKYSDIFDPTIKYGGGDASTRELLDRLSKYVSAAEENELKIAAHRKGLKNRNSHDSRARAILKEWARSKEGMKKSVRGLLGEIRSSVEATNKQ